MSYFPASNYNLGGFGGAATVSGFGSALPSYGYAGPSALFNSAPMAYGAGGIGGTVTQFGGASAFPAANFGGMGTIGGFGVPAPANKPIIVPPQQRPINPTPERVSKLLENSYAKLEALSTQLRQACSEMEELRAELVTANNMCDSELRGQLQQANDEIYKLREQLSEAAERKANKM